MEKLVQAQTYYELNRKLAEASRQHATELASETSRLYELQRRFYLLMAGGVRVDAEVQQKRLIHSVQPEYPDVAREAGIQGSVRLEVYVAEDGAVSDARVLAGERILADAALAAVRQWRYQPALLDGKPVRVVTRVKVEFRLD